MAKSSVPRVLLDSCAVIAWIKVEPEADLLGELLDLIDAGGAQLVESTFIFAEVFKPAGPNETWQPQMDAIQRKVRSKDVILADVTEPVARTAAELRLAHTTVKGMDAIHLATAVLNRCDWLVTKDRGFPSAVDALQIFDISRMASSSELPWVTNSEVTQPVLFA